MEAITAKLADADSTCSSITATEKYMKELETLLVAKGLPSRNVLMALAQAVQRNVGVWSKASKEPTTKESCLGHLCIRLTVRLLDQLAHTNNTDDYIKILQVIVFTIANVVNMTTSAKVIVQFLEAVESRYFTEGTLFPTDELAGKCAFYYIQACSQLSHKWKIMSDADVVVAESFTKIFVASFESRFRARIMEYTIDNKSKYLSSFLDNLVTFLCTVPTATEVRTDCLSSALSFYVGFGLPRDKIVDQLIRQLSSMKRMSEQTAKDNTNLAPSSDLNMTSFSSLINIVLDYFARDVVCKQAWPQLNESERYKWLCLLLFCNYHVRSLPDLDHLADNVAVSWKNLHELSLGMGKANSSICFISELMFNPHKMVSSEYIVERPTSAHETEFFFWVLPSLLQQELFQTESSVDVSLRVLRSLDKTLSEDKYDLQPDTVAACLRNAVAELSRWNEVCHQYAKREQASLLGAGLTLTCSFAMKYVPYAETYTVSIFNLLRHAGSVYFRNCSGETGQWTGLETLTGAVRILLSQLTTTLTDSSSEKNVSRQQMMSPHVFNSIFSFAVTFSANIVNKLMTLVEPMMSSEKLWAASLSLVGTVAAQTHSLMEAVSQVCVHHP
jgi:hypothetical protein